MRWPCVRFHTIFVFAEACSCFRLRASLDEVIVRWGFPRSCRFLLSVVPAFPTRRRFIDGGRALRARSAENCETAIRKRIARTVVTTVTRALERQRSLFACMCEEQIAKIEIESVQLRCCSVHTNTYNNIYSARKITTAVACPKAVFFTSTHTLFCVVGVVCAYVAINKRTLCSAQSFVVWWPLQQ